MASIRKIGGSWQVRWRLPDRRERSRRFAVEGDAEDFKVALEHTRRAGTYVDPRAGAMTVRGYSARWLAERRTDLGPRSWENKDGHLRNHVWPTFGDWPIASVQPADVRAWVGVIAADRAADTVKAVYLTLSQVMAQAEIDRVITRTPCVGVRLPRQRVRAEQRFTDAAGVRAIAEEIDRRYRAVILVAGFCGLRAGEIGGLVDTGVSRVPPRLHVVQALKELSGGGLVFGPTKNYQRRWVPMPRFVLAALDEHLERWPAPPDADGLVFTSAQGRPLRHSNFVDRHFKPALDAAGVDPRLRFHDLRHTAVSMMVAAGARIEQVSRIVGHSSIRVTIDTYGHLYDGHADELMDALDRSYAGAGEDSAVLTQIRQGRNGQ